MNESALPVPPSEQLFEDLLRNSHDLCVVLDPELRILRSGAAFEKLTGVTEPGGSFLDTIERFSLSKARPVFESVRSHPGECQELEVFHRGQGDETINIRYSWIASFDKEGECRAYLGLGRPAPPAIPDEEVDRLRQDLQDAQDELERMSAEIGKLRRDAETQSSQDELSGLSNRRYVMARLREEMARASRYDQPLTLVMADIDNLNQINEDHGRKAGDDVIRTVAGIVHEQVRGSDIPSRFEGGTFLILSPHTERTSAQFLAERLRRRVSELSFSGIEADFSVTISVGLVTVGAQNEFDLEAILQAADQALDAAKNGGRNRVQLIEVS